MPPTAVLSGYLVLGSYILSPAVVQVPQKAWTEPVLLWSTVAMPTGSGKSTLFRYLFKLLNEVRQKASVSDGDPSWVLDDASFEKMGALMDLNGSRILGLYDELSAFLAQINLYKGRSLSDSHELSLFLQLFNGHPWKRDTGKALGFLLQCVEFAHVSYLVVALMVCRCDMYTILFMQLVEMPISK